MAELRCQGVAKSYGARAVLRATSTCSSPTGR